MNAAKILVEIAAHTLDAAAAAQSGGADSVELFSNPVEGGVTPSEGLIATARKLISTKLYVLIRPRGGDFCYSDHEFTAMVQDIAVAKRLGADGVTLGVLKLDGTVDSERLQTLAAAAAPLPVTFHRAFDMCRDLQEALEHLIACGVQRVLSSGGAQTALEGGETLAQLARLGRERIRIVAAGGIKPETAREIVRRTGVRELHAGLRTTIPSPMRFRNTKIAFGPGSNEYEQVVVDEKNVRKLVEELGRL
ncbi:MAG: copper homeostasis protein CutC [Acidobacteria bacterium]|nr:copper homeostasis protein CutC [Acidobacteriota bacterium]